MYQALYRTYRPRQFKDVVGQDHAVAILMNALKRERLAHAYLFSGPRGIGKTTLARILAMAANCENPKDGEPCLACTPCLESNLHTVEIDAASNRGIDEIRDLKERARFLPAVGRRKVYIVDEAHMLTNEAFNALLKTLEEPPEHLLFLLATTEADRMPATVLSRCQRIHLRRHDEGEIFHHLTEVAEDAGIKADPEALAFLARKAEGSQRDGLALLDLVAAYSPEGVSLQDAVTALGSIPGDRLVALKDKLFTGDGKGLLALTDQLAREGVDFRQLGKDLLDDLRLMLLVAYGGSQGKVDVPKERLLTLVKAVADLEVSGRQGGDPRLSLELLFLSFQEEGHRDVREIPAPKPAPAPEEAKHLQKPVAPPEVVLKASPPRPKTKPSTPGEPFDVGRLTEALEKRNRPVVTVLDGVRGEIHGDEVWLYFPRKGNFIRAELEDIQETIRSATSRVLGRDVKLEMKLEGD